MSLSANPALPLTTAVEPGGGSDYFLHFAVISALGVAMIFWAFLIELPGVAILAVCATAMAFSVWLTPPAGEIATLWPYWKMFLFVPSHRDAVTVLYPWVPWLVPAGAGIVLGRIVHQKPSRTVSIALGAAGALIACYLVLGASRAGGMLKYPPTPAFLSITLAVDLLLVAMFALTARARLGFLDVLGRSPLVFYVLHLYVLAALSWWFPNGSSLPVMYGVWCGVMVATYPVVAAFARFKASTPVASRWRLV
jgi:uncharacterized membrane protein